MKRILIVEDELLTAMVLRLELGKEGYDVIGVVSSGADAITVSVDEKPDLILMDIFLNDDIDGVTAVEEIHKSAQISVIYLTASEDAETYERINKTEFAGIITKPYTITKLNQQIEQVFN